MGQQVLSLRGGHPIFQQVVGWVMIVSDTVVFYRILEESFQR